MNKAEYKVTRLWTGLDGRFNWQATLDKDIFAEVEKEPGIGDLSVIINNRICEKYGCGPQDFEVMSWLGIDTPAGPKLAVGLKIALGQEWRFMGKVACWVN